MVFVRMHHASYAQHTDRHDVKHDDDDAYLVPVVVVVVLVVDIRGITHILYGSNTCIVHSVSHPSSHINFQSKSHSVFAARASLAPSERASGCSDDVGFRYQKATKDATESTAS